MGRRKKLINNSDISQYAIDQIARCLLPDILAYYESEEGQQEYAKWLEEQRGQRAQGVAENTTVGHPFRVPRFLCKIL